MKKSDIEHLRWCYWRMVEVHAENKLIDYMQKFDSIIDGIAIDTLKADEKKPAEWVEGLPPIGEVCDINRHKQGWYKHRVLGYLDSYIWVVRMDIESHPGTVKISQLEFRPILTPKQRTIEAAMEATCACTSSVLTDILAQLYDLGHLTLPGESND